MKNFKQWSVNEWADYWRYEAGMNVIPADTKKKIPKIEWKQFKDKPILEAQHNQWKAESAFNDGIAVIVGKVWHNENKKNIFLNAIDLDNKKAIDEFCTINDSRKNLIEFSEHFLIEQHLDDVNRAHIYVWSEKPFKRKAPTNTQDPTIPKIEIKSQGDGLMFVTPSNHKNGHKYEILGDNLNAIESPQIFNNLEKHIDTICRKYNISYLDDDRNNNIVDGTKDKIVEALHLGYRHEGLLSYANSLIKRNPNTPHEILKEYAKLWNEKICKPPLDQKEFDQIWDDACNFQATQLKKEMKDKLEKKNNVHSEDTDASIMVKGALDGCRHLFTDQNKMPFAQVFIKDHYEVMGINSDRFKRYIVKLFYDSKENNGRIPGSESQNKAIQILIGKAEWENPTIPLHLRACRPSKTSPIYYDLTNEKWEQVEISKSGFKVITAEQSPVLFNRYNQIPQVTPEFNYSNDILDKFMSLTNVKNHNDILLAKVTLVCYFIPEIAHPIYTPYGGAGAAKSIFLTMKKRIVDPSTFDLLTTPTDKNEFLQQLGHNYMIFYDNLKEGRVPRWLPQDICSAITGGGNSKRMLFTDDEEFTRKYKRIVGFNGINIAMTEPDIASRSITCKMEPIPKTQNRTETEIYEEFDLLKPALLGFIFDTIVKTLNKYDSVKLTDLPRLGDFALWGETVARVLGYKEREFLEAYYENLEKQNAESVENDNIGETTLKLCEQLEAEGRTLWVDSISATLKKFKEIAEENDIDTKSKYWPKIANRLSRRLNEIRTSLKDGFGIEVTIEKLKIDKTVYDEITKFYGKPKEQIFKRDTRLVTIKRCICEEKPN